MTYRVPIDELRRTLKVRQKSFDSLLTARDTVETVDVQIAVERCGVNGQNTWHLNLAQVGGAVSCLKTVAPLHFSLLKA